MNNFCYAAPQSIEEAVKVLDGAGKDVKIIAGGTDFMIQMNKKIISPEKVVDLSKIKELKYVKEEKGYIKIGALTNFYELQNSKILNKNAKTLADACGEVGSPLIRNLGTIGGNVVNSSAAGDSITALMALGTSVVLKSTEGERIMTLEEFYQGPGECQIRTDEILTEVFFAKPSENQATGFVKLGKRKALAIVVISAAALIEKDEKNICTKAQVALGAISRYPIRIKEVEDMLVGKELNEENISKAVEKLATITETSVSNSPFKHLSLYKREGMKGISKEMFDKIMDQLN